MKVFEATEDLTSKRLCNLFVELPVFSQTASNRTTRHVLQKSVDKITTSKLKKKEGRLTLTRMWEFPRTQDTARCEGGQDLLMFRFQVSTPQRRKPAENRFCRLRSAESQLA